METKIGCCGFPKGRSIYYCNLSLVEIQKTFYQPPRLDTIKRWREEAPPDFRFTLKAWQLITHPPALLIPAANKSYPRERGEITVFSNPQRRSMGLGEELWKLPGFSGPRSLFSNVRQVLLRRRKI